MGWESAKAILSIGLSPFCMQVAASAVVVLINYQIHHYAYTVAGSVESAVAAFSNVNRLLMLIVMIVLGLNQGMQPIISFNYATKNYGRVTQTLVYAAVVATCVTIIGFIFGVFFPQWLVMIFTPDEEIIRLSATALRYFSLAFMVVGFQIVATGYFQSIGKPKISIFLSLTRQLIYLTPMLIVMPMFLGLNGVWLSSAASDFLASITAAAMLFWHLKYAKPGLGAERTE
ncbi:MAG: MATE family efflux transporter [Saezia sp.]